MSSPIETITTAGDSISLEDLAFHPLVKLELMTELKKWTAALEQIPPEQLRGAQGKVEILRWVLNRMPAEVVLKERERRKKAEAKE